MAPTMTAMIVGDTDAELELALDGAVGPDPVHVNSPSDVDEHA